MIHVPSARFRRDDVTPDVFLTINSCRQVQQIIHEEKGINLSAAT